MQLYVLLERWGSLSRSIRKPSRPSEEEIEEVRLEYAGLPPWLVLPDEHYMPGGPSLKTIMEWAFWSHLLARFVYGKAHVAVHVYVNRMIAQQAAAYLLASQIGKVIAYVVPPALMVLIVWLVNPVYSEFVWEDVFPWRYIGAYKERLWWMDFLQFNRWGRPVYVICGEISGVRLTEVRNSYYKGGRADYWHMGSSWVQEKDELFNYRRWVWRDAWVEYIGFLGNIGGGRYVLQRPFSDPYLAEVPPGYVRPPELLCKYALEIP
ncbi:hypothetical protein ES707_14768 [subsurface metagenome]